MSTDPDPPAADHRAATVGVLGFDGPTRPLVLALDALDDALRRLDQQLRAELGVSNIDIAALQYIDRRQRRGTTTRVRDLIVRLGVSSGTATAITHRLEQAHLVETTPDPLDARGRTLTLADRAHRLAEGLLQPVRRDLDALIDDLGPDREDELTTLLHRVCSIISTDHDAATASTH